MERIGDFGETFVDKKSEREICAFGEDCTGTVPEIYLRICAFGEDCGEAAPTNDGVGPFGEHFEDRPSAADICAFGEPCAEGTPEPEQRICAFGEECPPN